MKNKIKLLTIMASLLITFAISSATINAGMWSSSDETFVSESSDDSYYDESSSDVSSSSSDDISSDTSTDVSEETSSSEEPTSTQSQETTQPFVNEYEPLEDGEDPDTLSPDNNNISSESSETAGAVTSTINSTSSGKNIKSYDTQFKAIIAISLIFVLTCIYVLVSANYKEYKKNHPKKNTNTKYKQRPSPHKK